MEIDCMRFSLEDLLRRDSAIMVRVVLLLQLWGWGHLCSGAAGGRKQREEGRDRGREQEKSRRKEEEGNRCQKEVISQLSGWSLKGREDTGWLMKQF